MHIVDLNGGALQWLSLLSARTAPPSCSPALLRVTGFGVSVALLHNVGNQLAGLASKLDMPFELCAVAAAVSSGLLLPGKRHREAVAVHWLCHTMYDAAWDEDAALRWSPGSRRWWTKWRGCPEEKERGSQGSRRSGVRLRWRRRKNRGERRELGERKAQGEEGQRGSDLWVPPVRSCLTSPNED
ncbi:hypothetical protein BRADI_2g13560v3 [Brachypodium distachyon]|uniref:Uncharacterized protein n=1 Tax=Brachypodium distachyon TaxID=15368 RepID=I1HFJ5_BRADI|nr:hypothetical protein BRADI_2g13560v3 [Brachypodium distachyon]